MSVYLPSRFKTSNVTIDNISITQGSNAINVEYSGYSHNDIVTNVELQAKFAIVASVGLHYFYYTNHQFFLTYQIREYGGDSIYLKNNIKILAMLASLNACLHVCWRNALPNTNACLESGLDSKQASPRILES